MALAEDWGKGSIWFTCRDMARESKASSRETIDAVEFESVERVSTCPLVRVLDASSSTRNLGHFVNEYFSCLDLHVSHIGSLFGVGAYG